MSEIKISDLTETTSVDEDITYVPIDDGTSTKKITLKHLEESATASAQAYAEAAAASATSASGYADAASTSASNASTYASNASDSAVIAESASSAASGYSDTASAAASNASSSASSAASSATSAAQQVSSAQNYAKLSESWTQGNTGTRAGEDTNNAKYWAQQAAAMHDGVASFNGRQGIVNPADGDYSASMISRGSSTVDNDLTSLENGMSTAEGMIAPVENAATMTQGYAIGEEFIRENVKYKAKAAITSGASWSSLVLGTDYELATDVSSQMQTLTSDLSDLSDKTYKTDDAAETTMEDDDYIPFYDSSAQTTKKISKENAKFGGGGSVITITTTEDDLIGKTVTVTDGTNTFSGVFGSDYTAIIENVTATGTLTISSTGTSETASTTLEVTYFGKYSASLAFYTLFGFHVDSTVSDPEDAVSYQVQYNNKNVDNYNYSAGAMDFTNDVWSYGSWSEDDFFMPKPCLVSQDYTDIIYLNPDNYTVDVDGNDVSAKLTGSTDGYNAMVEWGKNGKQIWYKLVPDSDATSYTVYICDKQLDSDFVAWSFYDANNVLGDHFYTSIYNGAVVSNVMRSLSGKTPNNTTAGATQITYAKANNQNSESYAWYIDTFADRVLINLLLILVTKSLNSDVIGYGNYTGGSSASNLLTTGTGNTKGMFYGKRSNAVVKVFGMENWFANCWRRMAGLVLNSGSLLYKMTYGTADGSSAAGYIESDSAPSNYLTGNTISTSLSSSYIMKQTAKTDGSLLPSTFGGANGTYYSDACWSGTGVKYALVGGSCHNSSACGAFALALNNALSNSYWYCGCALSLKPLAQ